MSPESSSKVLRAAKPGFNDYLRYPMFLYPVRWPFICLQRKNTSSANLWSQNVGLALITVA